MSLESHSNPFPEYYKRDEPTENGMADAVEIQDIKSLLKDDESYQRLLLSTHEELVKERDSLQDQLNSIISKEKIQESISRLRVFLRLLKKINLYKEQSENSVKSKEWIENQIDKLAIEPSAIEVENMVNFLDEKIEDVSLQMTPSLRRNTKKETIDIRDRGFSEN